MVLIFWGGFGQGDWWYIGPLLTFMPLVLGLLGLPLSLLGLLFGFGGSTTWIYDPASQLWRREGAQPSGGARTGDSSGSSSSGSSGSTGAAGDGGGGAEAALETVSSVLTGLTSMVVTAALTVILMKLFLSARRHGWRTALRRLLLEGFFGGWDEPGGQGQQQGRRLTRSRSERIEKVAQLMQARGARAVLIAWLLGAACQSLPVEVYRSRQELERLSTAELKQLLTKRGLGCKELLEKPELVAALSEGSNSTAASCSICCDDYQSDDVLRVLRCGHRFHLECIDRWLLSSTDYSRPPACPMCNQPLEEVAAAAAAAAAAAGGGAS